MLNIASEVFSVEKVTLQNIYLLPEDRKPRVYFVMLTQGEHKNIIYVGFTHCLRQKWINHHRKIEFEFLNRIGYQINIFGIVLPEITHVEGQAVQALYRKVLQPKLNRDRNSFAVIQAEQIKKQIKFLEEKECENYKKLIKKSPQDRYEDLKKQIEIWEQDEEDKSTIIDKIWTACQPLP